MLATITVEKFEDAMPLGTTIKKYKTRFGAEFTTISFDHCGLWGFCIDIKKLKHIVPKNGQFVARFCDEMYEVKIRDSDKNKVFIINHIFVDFIQILILLC